jgi:hypothetical protein
MDNFEQSAALCYLVLNGVLDSDYRLGQVEESCYGWPNDLPTRFVVLIVVFVVLVCKI